MLTTAITVTFRDTTLLHLPKQYDMFDLGSCSNTCEYFSCIHHTPSPGPITFQYVYSHWIVLDHHLYSSQIPSQNLCQLDNQKNISDFFPHFFSLLNFFTVFCLVETVAYERIGHCCSLGNPIYSLYTKYNSNFALENANCRNK